ncbi:hypothetical protein IWW49_001845 [Coemansia sp. RSA 1797]|nr:hypothetical protein IWW49_001845 [Coemansia sp. RSA 1797]
MSTTLGNLLRLSVRATRVHRRWITIIPKRTRVERHSSLLPETWIISDDNAITNYSTAGVAHALGLPVETKRVTPQPTIPIIGQLSGLRSLFGESSNGKLSCVEDAYTESMPRFAIAATRQALPGLLEIRKRTDGRTMTVYLGLPDTKLSNVDALLLTRLDQMKLRSIGPGRANLDNAISTLLPISGLSPITPVSAPDPSVVICIGTGFEPSGFRLLTTDYDRIVDGILHLPLSRIRIVMDPEPNRGMRTALESRVVKRIREQPIDPNSTKKPVTDVEVIDYAVGGQPPLAEVLASATHVIATADNIPVISMAVSMGLPVYIAGMERVSNELRSYYHMLDGRNLVRRFYPQNSRYSYMLAPDITGNVDEFSAIRDHDPWGTYDAQQDLSDVAEFIKERYIEINS